MQDNIAENVEDLQPVDRSAVIIRTMVRSVYDLQGIRIQMGNRITANWKSKLGLMSEGLNEAQLEKQEKKVLKQLRDDYKRITDGIIKEGDDAASKIPTARKFKGTELIDSYAELVLVDQYMQILSSEERMFRSLTTVLKDNPVYMEFLQHVDGVGPAMAAVLLSEIDLSRANYPSSLWKLAGLDTVTVGKYVDANGVEGTIPGWQIEEFHALNGPDAIMMAHDRYPVTLVNVGRSKQEHCLVWKDYKAADGTIKKKKSITFNPFLKTKLVGVLAGSFLKVGTSTVNGKKVGKANRLEMAKNIGFKEDPDSGLILDLQVVDFLRERGYEVVIEPSPYARMYYDYKNRLQNSPAHKDKTDLHRHRMSLRYVAKMFLNEFYAEGRKILGLPVVPTYAEAKLGLTHGVVDDAKEAFYKE